MGIEEDRAALEYLARDRFSDVWIAIVLVLMVGLTGACLLLYSGYRQYVLMRGEVKHLRAEVLHTTPDSQIRYEFAHPASGTTIRRLTQVTDADLARRVIRTRTIPIRYHPTRPSAHLPEDAYLALDQGDVRTQVFISAGILLLSLVAGTVFFLLGCHYRKTWLPPLDVEGSPGDNPPASDELEQEHTRVEACKAYCDFLAGFRVMGWSCILLGVVFCGIRLHEAYKSHLLLAGEPQLVEARVTEATHAFRVAYTFTMEGREGAWEGTATVRDPEAWERILADGDIPLVVSLRNPSLHAREEEYLTLNPRDPFLNFAVGIGLLLLLPITVRFMVRIARQKRDRLLDLAGQTPPASNDHPSTMP